MRTNVYVDGFESHRVGSSPRNAETRPKASLAPSHRSNWGYGRIVLPLPRSGNGYIPPGSLHTRRAASAPQRHRPGQTHTARSWTLTSGSLLSGLPAVTDHAPQAQGEIRSGHPEEEGRRSDSHKGPVLDDEQRTPEARHPPCHNLQSQITPTEPKLRTPPDPRQFHRSAPSAPVRLNHSMIYPPPRKPGQR